MQFMVIASNHDDVNKIKTPPSFRAHQQFGVILDSKFKSESLKAFKLILFDMRTKLRGLLRRKHSAEFATPISKQESFYGIL